MILQKDLQYSISTPDTRSATMVHGLISEQPKAAPKAAKSQEPTITAEYESPVKSALLDDGIAQMALFGTLAAMAVMVYKAGTA